MDTHALDQKLQNNITKANFTQSGLHLLAVLACSFGAPASYLTFLVAIAPWFFGNAVTALANLSRASRSFVGPAFLLTQINGPLLFVFLISGELDSLALLIGGYLFALSVTWGAMIGIYYDHVRCQMNPAKGLESDPIWSEVIDSVKSQKGSSVAELSNERPLILLFLRHQGCTFCREALADLKRSQSALQEQGFTLGVVHMSTVRQGSDLLKRFDLEDVHHFSDPQCQLYRAFELQRGRLSQILSPSIIWRGFKVALIQKLGFGAIVGDAFQLGGAFIVERGEITHHFRARLASDSADLCELAQS